MTRADWPLTDVAGPRTEVCFASNSGHKAQLAFAIRRSGTSAVLGNRPLSSPRGMI